MISWKYSFEKVSKELELVKKKKQALENLFSGGKISQSTYDNLNAGLTNAIAEVEARQKTLAGKMTAKIQELEGQVKTLEMFLANTEIEYAAGEIDEELHERETSALAIGLEAARQQLNVIKEAVGDLSPEEAGLVPPPPPGETVEEGGEETSEILQEPQIEAPEEKPQEVDVLPEEVTPEQPVETVATEEAETLPEIPVEETPAEDESLQPNEEPIEESVTIEDSESSEDAETSETAEASETAEIEMVEEETPVEESNLFQSEEETTTEYEE